MSELKKCPRCQGELEQGFLVTNHPLWWDTKEHLLIVGGEQLVDFNFVVLNLEAHRCKKCKLIIFQYTGLP